MKKEVLTTFEIKEKVKRVPIAFIVKEEIEVLEGIEIVQKKVNMSHILKATISF